MTDADWDYIIVGAGSAGCVLADRLSADSGNRVLLLEAGPQDSSPFIAMPGGAAKLYGDPRHTWFFATEAHDGVPGETWIRGKVLGGSSSINGMMYFRGQPQDYDGWEEKGARGWGWSAMAQAFRAIEGHELGPDAVRGGEGPLHVSLAPDRTPFTEAFIAAGEQMGLRRVEDLNQPAQEGVGYATRTIRRGRRVSAATAFLKPAMRRPNLTVQTGVTVSRVLFENKVATAVEAMTDAGPQIIRATGEIILAAGALTSPQILQRSGVGDPALLHELAIPIVADNPGVGEHMLEHRLLMTQYDLAGPYSNNRQLRGIGLLRSILRYQLLGRGPLAAGYGTVAAFARVLPDAETPDVEILMTPTVANPDEQGRFIPDPKHCVQLFGYPLRSRSEGFVRIASADAAVPARIKAGYLTHPYDQAVTIAMHRFIRRWMGQPALRTMVARERDATRALETDDQILAAFRTQGLSGYHACGTCRMGGDDAVLDPRCRVRGVGGLRVVDGSIMPAMVSANTNGPIMAAAWRAAQLILEDRHVGR